MVRARFTFRNRKLGAAITFTRWREGKSRGLVEAERPDALH